MYFSNGGESGENGNLGVNDKRCLCITKIKGLVLFIP